MASLDVKIPPMGESISSGVLAKWHVKDGDVVKKDQPLFELETDKITSDGTAESAGKITLKVATGTEVKIGVVVATIDTSVAAAPAAALPAKVDEAKGTPADGHPQSPAVRRLAAESGIDPAGIAGTGKAGRVTKGDILAAAEAPTSVSSAPPTTPANPSPSLPPAAPATPPTPAGKPASARQSRRKMTPLRQRIAQRLVAAQHEAAMLTTFNEVDMSAVMALRSKYQDDFVKKNGLKLGFMSFFTKAVVHALKEVTSVNAQIDGDHVVENHFYDIGVAVSTEKGLMVPVIRNCDTLGMAEIEKSIGDAAKKARDGKITLADLDGGVFTITNGGIFGSMLSTPIINPPQSAILGVHATKERAVVENGQVVVRPMNYLALSYDHRIIDGREAVLSLVAMKEALEDPARLILDV